MTIQILSSHSNPRLAAPVNHQVYAGRHGYRYLFDATPYPLRSRYDQKLHAIIGALERMPDDDVLAWVDDDVYFMQLDRPLAEFAPDGVLSVCHSPVNPTGGWSRINSGVMLIRAGRPARDLFGAALDTPFDDVRVWWDEDVHGNVCIDGGDQERLLFQIDRLGLEAQVAFHPAEAFNARVYHFTERADQHFTCHAASHTYKPAVLAEMRRRFPQLDQYLLPAGAAERANTTGLFGQASGLVGEWEDPDAPPAATPPTATPDAPTPPAAGLFRRAWRAGRRGGASRG